MKILIIIVCFCVVALSLIVGFGKDERYNLVSKQGNYINVVIDKNISNHNKQLFEVADRICGKDSRCSVQFWDDEKYVPTSGYPTQHQMDYKIALYLRDKTNGIDQIVRKNVPIAIDRKYSSEVCKYLTDPACGVVPSGKSVMCIISNEVWSIDENECKNRNGIIRK